MVMKIKKTGLFYRVIVRSYDLGQLQEVSFWELCFMCLMLPYSLFFNWYEKFYWSMMPKVEKTLKILMKKVSPMVQFVD